MTKPTTAENSVSLTCIICKQEFLVWPSVVKWSAAKYCSRECYYARSKRPGGKASLFWAKVEKTDDCWLWKASTKEKGYGAFHREDGKPCYAHRYSYELAYGPIPDGLNVLHRCDTPRCVRPDHLFLGTQADNAADMVAKNRQCLGERNGAAKLTEDDIREIRHRNPVGIEAVQGVADEFGVSQARVYSILKRDTWKHVAG